jgi:O-antigen/teichoic acid export membrane protein
MILATPLNLVAGGTYAELKEDKVRLSKAFFRANAFLVRTGFLLAGIFALVAPEFIVLALGERWLPMLDAFRLMLIFTMFDPMKRTVADLFVAVGHPEKVVGARIVQLIVMIGGLFLFAPLFGITGVALAVDIMLVVGIGLLLWNARPFVTFSVKKLFLMPGLTLGVGLLIARAAILLPGVAGSPWRTGPVKATVFVVVYGVMLFLLERNQTMRMMSIFVNLLPQRLRNLVGKSRMG